MLGALFNRNGSDKYYQHQYHIYYEPWLHHFRDCAFSMLEVGFGAGQSAHAWLEYFPLAQLAVMDIGTDAATTPRLKIVKGDQSSEQDRQAVIDALGAMAIIVDDGSHIPEHQIATFNHFFVEMLQPGGVYIIEDIETSYWKSGDCYGYDTRYGREHPLNIVNVFSNILHDSVNKEFQLSPPSPNNHPPLTPDATKNISQVVFARNCVIVRKKNAEELSTADRPYRFAEKLKSWFDYKDIKSSATE
jgi:hypothetical protein